MNNTKVLNRRAFKKYLSLLIVAVMLLSNVAFADSTIKKDESVYVNLGADGSVKEAIVSDWLHSDQANVEIKDKSDLKNIINVKGEEVPVMDNGSLTWKTDKNDIFYQGTSSKELPLGIKISYSMDGTEMQPQDMAGKSGHMKVTIEIKNKLENNVTIDGVNKVVYTPFTVIGVMNMSLDTFRDVKVNAGQVFSDGNNQVVTFISLPGLKENFSQIKNIVDLPDTIEIEANVTNFKMGPIMITATPKLPDVDSMKNANKINELIDGIRQLKDASAKLSEATAMLAENQNKLAKGAGDLKMGLERLDKGSLDLKAGIGKLNAGLTNAKSGAEQLNGGVNALTEGASKLGAGAQAFGSGAVEFALNSVKFAAGAALVADGASQVAEKTGDLSKGANALVAATDQLIAGQQQLTAGAEKTLQGIQSLKAGKQKEMQVLDVMIGGMDQLIQLVGAMKQIPGVGELAVKLEGGLQQQKQGLVGLKDAGTQFLGGLDQLQAGVAAMQTGSQKLNAGLTELQNGQKKLAAGADQLAAGGAKLKPAADQLKQGGQGLTAGAGKLDAASKELSNGANTFTAGSQKLAAGTQGLKDGLGQLQAGSQSLAAGFDQYSTGVGAAAKGAATLYDGASKLADGATQLDAGMKKFDQEGIQKLDNEINGKIGNIDELLSIKDKVYELSKDYGTFSGIGESMEGTTKFIMKTDEIKAVSTVEKDAKPKTEEKKGFFQWLKGLFS